MYTVEAKQFGAWWKTDETDSIRLAKLFAAYHSVKTVALSARVVKMVDGKAVVIHEYQNGEQLY